MRQNLEYVQSAIGLSEGGYVNNKKDPGGATDRGITQKTFDGYNDAKGFPRQPVKGISKNLAEQIIYENYMRPVRFDDLPSGLDYAVADYAVNSGPARAVKELQRLIGVSADGVMGNITISRIREVENAHEIPDLIIRYCEARIAFMKQARHPQTKELLWPTFKNGWTTRVMGKTDGPQPGRDIGVIDRALALAGGAKSAPMPAPVVSAKAPEPEAPATIGDDPASVGGLIGGTGALGAFGALVGSFGGLHPVVQAIAVVGLLVALAGAYWTITKRAQSRAVGLG